MIFYPGLLMPNTCPACGAEFWLGDDGHNDDRLDSIETQIEVHARYFHGAAGMNLILRPSV